MPTLYFPKEYEMYVAGQDVSAAIATRRARLGLKSRYAARCKPKSTESRCARQADSKLLRKAGSQSRACRTWDECAPALETNIHLQPSTMACASSSGLCC